MLYKKICNYQLLYKNIFNHQILTHLRKFSRISKDSHPSQKIPTHFLLVRAVYAGDDVDGNHRMGSWS